MKRNVFILIIFILTQGVLHARKIDLSMPSYYGGTQYEADLSNVVVNVELGDTIDFIAVPISSASAWIYDGVVDIVGIINTGWISTSPTFGSRLIYRFVPQSIQSYDFFFMYSSGGFFSSMFGTIEVTEPIISLTGYEVAIYPLDGHANDLSGNNHNGNLFGPTTSVDRFGNPNGALQFQLNDFVDINDGVFFTGSAFSLSFWFKMDQVNNSGTMVKLSDELKVGFNGNNLIEVSLASKSLVGNLIPFASHDIVQSVVINTNPVPLNTWHNIIISCKRMLVNIPSEFSDHNIAFYGGNYFEIFLNGMKVFSSYPSHPDYPSGNSRYCSTDRLFNKTLSPIFGENFIGHLDDIHMWSTEVNSLEAQAIYNNQGLSVNENNIISLSCFPNPVKDVLHLKGGEIESVFIYDASGRLLLESNDDSINVSHFASGLYTLVINGTNSMCFVKE